MAFNPLGTCAHIPETHRPGAVVGFQTTVRERPAMANLVIVEDYAPFRNWVEFVIQRNGHDVRVFATAEAALEEINGQTKIDLLLTDLQLPAMNGLDFSDRVRDHVSNVRVLFMSIEPLDDLWSRGLKVPEDRFFKKPFKLTQQVDRIDLLRPG